MASGSSNQNVRAALIVAILALLALNIYQYSISSSLQKENKQQDAELIEIVQVKEELEQQYYEALSNLEEMKGSNEEMNARIENQQNELTQQKERIGVLLKDRKNLFRARNELKSLKERNEKFLAEIEALKQENEELSATNMALTSKTHLLTHEVHIKDSINLTLEKSKSELQKERDAINAEKLKISKKYNKASAIVVNKLEIKGYKIKSNGKATRKYWAKNIDLLKICFNTTPNEYTDNGSEVFFVRIINPAGEVLTFDNGTSGIMESLDQGMKIKYSFDILMDYNRDKLKICKQWQSNAPFISGTYTLEVYNHGYLTGTDHFKLL